MTEHESFEVLCTLAATSQLGAAERVDFEEHCLNCPACCEQLRDLIAVGAALQFDVAIHATPVSMPAGSFERFRARAVRAGVAPRPKSTGYAPSRGLASAAAVFCIVAALVVTASGRRIAEDFSVSAVPPVSSRQSLSASVTEVPRISQPSKGIHRRFVRRDHVARSDAGVNDATLTAQRFPEAITASYPIFGSQSATKATPTRYPALSRTEISNLDLFHYRDDYNKLNVTAVVEAHLPIDIASTGKGFDFAADIHELHFQLPTAQ